MATSLFTLPFRPSLISKQNVTPFVCAACRREQSSFRRQRKALRVKVDASFLPSKTETRDHIIFNPPSSAPNVYHTPLKFLPKSDPRRKLHSLAPAASATPPSTPADPDPSAAEEEEDIDTAPAPKQPRLPKPVRPQYEKKYHLGKDEIEEIRRLRQEDPRKWTRVRLAEKFECSQFFVSLCCVAPEIADERDRELAEIKKRWGRRKTEAREERKARKKLWGRDV